MASESRDKPFPEIARTECKGCGRCTSSCPKNVLQLSDEVNGRGYHFCLYLGEGCTGCGNCFYACPEPYVIKIHIPEKKGGPDAVAPGSGKEA